MKLFLTGGTGFVGKALCEALAERGDKLTVLSRQRRTVVKRTGVPVEPAASPGDVRNSAADAVVNLAGVPIADRRWSQGRKKALHDSRVGLTRELVESLAEMDSPPRTLISASAVGYYGDTGSRLLNEESRYHDDYTHELCAAWEQAALTAEELGIRVCIVRIGLVLGAGGGLLKRMLPVFRLGLGGRLGSGEQWMSWVHRDDLVRTILYLLDHETLQGIFNATAPGPVRNREFTSCLARQLRKPTLLPVPAGLLRIGLGEMSSLLLTGQRVAPRRLLDAGFEFQYPRLGEAMQSIID